MPWRRQFATSFRVRADHARVEAEGVAVDPAVRLREGGGLAVRDHHDLLHVLALAGQDALGEAQALARVRVVRPHAHLPSWQSGTSSAESWKSTRCRLSPGYCVRMRWLRASATFLAGREAVLAVQDHAVRAVEHDHRGARATGTRSGGRAGPCSRRRAGPSGPRGRARTGASRSRRGSGCRRTRRASRGPRTRCRWRGRACRGGRTTTCPASPGGRAASCSPGSRRPSRSART